ncbi:Uncharacterized conserved protein, DUF169 family [Desulfacinum hydrothermale DSM 13146]|uniref:Uncharacterized conserved protein, DUF169 family n=1 Tax=Desulfacinum hydrothermale DSM 13146 TaxID=1121390 RepID=A0A1W1X897_9BACT|nr:DUF169 domain-containing protein [Desulfacinum hydrothermale]SMC20050.1 Uncharacterized conserved protein, DUF169 family [Desulfacinum hydrothermale DSM 13146]
MTDYQQAQAKIMEAIRPRSFPLAVSFLAEGESFPEKTRRPGTHLHKRVAICQAITMARLYGWTVGVTRDDVVCVPAMIAWGWSGAQDGASELQGLFATVGFAEDEGTAADQVASMGLPQAGEVEGILLSPLAKARKEPQCVVIYCNPAQAMRLVQALTWRTGGVVQGAFGGKVECVQTLYAAHRHDEPRVSIPGMGDRIFSMTQDDELVVALPVRLLADLVQGLDEAGRRIGARYPVTFYQNFQPVYPEHYQEVAKRLGLFD